MSFRSSELLQFDELKRLVASYAGSAAGKERVLVTDTGLDRTHVEAALLETGEGIRYLQDAASPQKAGHGAVIRLRFDQVRDLETALPRLRVEGARLEGHEILDLFHTLAIAGEYRSLLLAVADRFPRLAARARSLA